ncbi:MAG: hypothetical protein A7315_04835 [Candidatus Altiarchaeales archaeon WOR_SM1_79]|nr:MAG: hypothetical protein A7315_04835 [Candidatus Altiarchaeales archaeon WOR_SM1_79]
MYLIVGIDPGTTLGIAALNFRGELIALHSSRDMGLNAAVRYLMHIRPDVIVSEVAGDVSPTPGFISKLGASLDAVVFSPKQSLSVREKVDLTAGYGVENAHQRDALASAINAFNHVKNKFEHIDSLGVEKADEVKHLVLRGYSITHAEETLEKKEVVEEKIEVEEKDTGAGEVKDGEAERLKKQVKRLNIGKQNLEDELKKREEEIKDLNIRISRMKRKYGIELRKDPEIRKRDKSINRLKNSVRSLKTELNCRLKDIDGLTKLWVRLARGEVAGIGIFPEAVNGITWIRRGLRRRDYDLLNNFRIALVDKKIRVDKRRVKDVLTADSKVVKEIAGCGYIEAGDAEALEKKFEKEYLVGVGGLKKIVNDYRKERV